MAKKVNLGCGRDYREGYINIDKKPGLGNRQVDIEDGLPFPDNSVERIIAKDVLEHIENLEYVVSEMYRVCRGGALIFVQVPYYRTDNAFAYEHEHFFRKRTVEKLFSSPRFKIVRINFLYTSLLGKLLAKLPLGLFDNLKGNIQAIIRVEK